MQEKNSQKPRDYFSYYCKKFPEAFRQDFSDEATALWNEIETGLMEACQPAFPNYDLLLTIIPKLEVLLSVYGPSKDKREMVITILLKVLLEEKATAFDKTIITRMITVTLGNGNFKSLRLNWKAILNFLDEVTSETVVMGGLAPKRRLLKEVGNLVSKVRVFYPEESVEQVLRHLRQSFDPSVLSGFEGSRLLNFFFNVEAPKGNKEKLGQEYFEKTVLPELFAFWNGRRYQSESAYLSVLDRIARKYPNIDWTPYYEKLFTFFMNAIKSVVPQTSDGKQGGRGRSRRDILTQGKSPLSLVATLLVRIMRPKTANGGEQYWENLERIYRFTLPFIHPENTGEWTSNLAQFYNDLCKVYLRRAKQEQKQKDKSRSRNKEAATEGKFQFDFKEEDEEGENGNEIDLGILGEEEDKDGEDKNDEEEDETEENEEDEEEKSEIDAQDAQKKEEKREYFLDEDCHTIFLGMIKYIMKNLIYSRDSKATSRIARTFRRLIFFKPEEFGPFLINILQSFFQRSELNQLGAIKILMLSAYPLISRKNYKNGIFQIPRLLDLTLEHLTSHDMKKTAFLLEFYEVVFSLVPIYHPQDLIETYGKIYEVSDERTIKQKFNEGEDEDIWQLNEDFSDWAVKFFKKFINLMRSFELTDGVKSSQTTALIIQYRNFHSLIFQSSPRLIRQYQDILKSYLEENIKNPPNQFLQDIINPLNLRDADSTLGKLIPLFKNQLLSKGSKNAESYVQRSLYHLVQKSSISSQFQDYELAVTNKDTLLRILTVLENVLSFSSPALLKHRSNLELIIFHCLLHQDHAVFSQAARLVHTILLSLLSVYPTNLGSTNPRDFTREEFCNIFKKIGLLPKRNLELEWHLPNEQETQYAQELFALFFEKNIQGLETLFLSNIHPQKMNDVSILGTLLDDLNLKNVDISSTQREILGRSLILLNYTFLGISQRSSYGGVAELSKEKSNFEEKFNLKAFNNAREILCNLGNRLVQYTFSSLYVKDPEIGNALVQLIGTIFEEEDQYDELQRIAKILRQKKRAFELEGSYGNIYENRYLMTIHANVKLQERIIWRSTTLQYKENAIDLLYILWLFKFHPIEEVAKQGVKYFRRETLYLKPAKKNEVLLNVSNYTIQIISERFNFLKSNAKELEEKKALKFKGNEIIQNNKDSYVDTLLKGTIFNLEYLLAFLSNHLENLFQFIQILLDVPKTDDTSFLLRFSRIISGIDFSPYSEDDLNGDTKENVIITSNDLYQQYQQKSVTISLPKQKLYDKQHIFPHIEAQMKKVIFSLSYEESHWKFQVVSAFTGAILSPFFSPKSEILTQFIVCVFKQLLSEHLYLRYFASSAFTTLIKIHTEQFRKNSKVKRKPEDFAGFHQTIDEAFHYHFLRKEDYQNNFLKSPYIGTLEFYDEFKVDNLKEPLPQIELPADLIEQIQGKEFLHKLISNFVADVPNLDENAAQKGSGGILGLLGKLAFNFKSFIGEFFKYGSHQSTRDPRKYVHFSSSFLKNEASLLRILFKYFNGPRIFENSIDLIEEFAKDLNSREKQAIAAHYFYAVLKTFKFWDQSAAKEAVAKLVEILSHVIDNVNADIFAVWDLAFSYAIKGLDYRIVRAFSDLLLQNPFEKKLANIQGRYLSIYGTIIDRNGTFSEGVSERLLDILIQFKPTETRQVEHISQILIGLLKSYILNPVNYNKLKKESIILDLDSIILNRENEFILESQYFLFKVNQKLETILQNYFNWTKEAKDSEENKIFLQLLFILGSSFNSKKLPYSLYFYYEKIIFFLLQLNNDEISLNPNTIQLHKDTLSALSQLFYPVEAIPRILNVIDLCLKAKNPKIRENTLKFYQFFYYNHLYYLKSKTVDTVIGGILDENPAVKKAAFEAMIDIFRVYTEKEITETLSRARKLVAEHKSKKNDENVTKGLMVLMAIVLSRPLELEEWTNATLEFLFEMKRYSKMADEKFSKEFALKFWQDHPGRANINERELSYEVYSDLREIGNPSSYFA